ncbi:MAG: OmpA family protein [Flavobacteriales bacterium]
MTSFSATSQEKEVGNRNSQPIRTNFIETRAKVNGLFDNLNDSGFDAEQLQTEINILLDEHLKKVESEELRAKKPLKEIAKIKELRGKLANQFKKRKQLAAKITAKNSKIEELRGKLTFLYSKQKTLYGKLEEKNGKLETLRNRIETLRQKTQSFRKTSVDLKRSEPVAYSKLKGRFAKNWLGEKNETLGFVVEDDRVILGADSLFASGSTSVRKSAIPQLRAVGRKLSNMAKNLPDELDWVFAFEGHADPSPIKSGKFKTNLELSLARAQAVHRIVMGYTVLPEDKISIASFGSSRPRNENKTPADYAENRRVEIRLISR